MNDKRIPIVNDQPKHKKKSKAKGQPRADHKHIYEPVLLYRPHKNHYTGEITDIITVNTVCQICGRIDDTLHGDEWYDGEAYQLGKYRFMKDRLNAKALALPHWYTDDYWDKFAYQNDETNSEYNFEVGM